jgi:precorrin-6B methylase 2
VYPRPRVDLADTERLLSAPDRALVAFREALRAAAFDERFLARLARVGERLDDPLRAPIRVWRARRLTEPAATIARLLVLHDPMGRDEAARALGDLAPLLDCGLIEEADGGLVSRMHLALAGELYVLGDRGADDAAVPPLNGVTGALARAAIPRRPVGGALDLGCGAGALSLALARTARRVVATDVDLRALSMTRLNARLNGVGNIELRHGDLFEAVGTEPFDRIVSQPPFVARPEGAETSAYMHGGRRGDEIPLRAIAAVASHLRAGGRAVFLADWPLYEGDALDARVRAATGDAPLDVLVLQSPNKDLDEYCTQLAAAKHARLDGAFERAIHAQRDHMERLGLRGVSLAFVVLEPSLGPPQTSLVSVRHIQDVPVTVEAIDRILAARALCSGEAGPLLEARLRMPEGTRLVEQPGTHATTATVIVQLPAGRPEWPMVIEARAAWVLRKIDEAPTVRDAALSLARDERVAVEDAVALVERVARGGLLRGALTPP